MNAAKTRGITSLLLVMFLVLSVVYTPTFGNDMKNMKVEAAATEIVCDDSMPVAGGIFPGNASGQEGEIRASAVVIEGNIKIAIVRSLVVPFVDNFKPVA